MTRSVHTRLIDLQVTETALEVDVHVTVPDGPALHLYTHCCLSHHPLTKEDCRNLVTFFSELEEVCQC